MADFVFIVALNYTVRDAIRYTNAFHMARTLLLYLCAFLLLALIRILIKDKAKRHRHGILQIGFGCDGP